MWNSIKRFFNEEEAATAVEYCVMVSLILLAVFAGVTATGISTNDWWQNIGTEMTNFGM